MGIVGWFFLAVGLVIIVVVTLAPFVLGPRFFDRATRRRVRHAMNDNMYAPPPGDPLTGAPFPVDDEEDDARR